MGAQILTHIIRGVQSISSAPTRIDLAGGTIDIWPLYLFHDGATTLNAAISLRAHVEIEARTDGAIELRSIDTDRTSRATHWSELDGAGDLSLLALLARHYRLENATLTTRGESPAGAGIAGSSALTIAVCGALARWTGAPSDPEHLLQVAMNVECQTIRVPTGVQDYRPALYGGIAAIELGVTGVTRAAPSTSIRASSSSGSCWPTPARRATPAPTTGRSPSGTSTATGTSSTASSGSATRRWRCARRSSAATGTRSAGRSRSSGTTASAWRPASRRRRSTI